MNKTKLKKTSYVLIASLCSPAILTSCNDKADPKTIFVSCSPVCALVKEVVGNIRPIEVITPDGVEAHDYEISARKVARVYDGLGLFINGLGMECWENKLPKTAKEKTYTLSEGINTVCIDGNIDPHIWLNPQNAIKELEIIKNVMISIDSANSADYLSNYRNAVVNFSNLDSECEQIANDLNNKYLCVSHAAFGYLCDRYGLTQISVNGLEAGQEPTTKTLEQIISLVKKYKITTIFAEEIGNKEISKKIADETGCSLEILSTMESMGESETYCSVFKDNFEKIKEAGK